MESGGVVKLNGENYRGVINKVCYYDLQVPIFYGTQKNKIT